MHLKLQITSWQAEEATVFCKQRANLWKASAEDGTRERVLEDPHEAFVYVNKAIAD